MTVENTDMSSELSLNKEKLLNISAKDWERVLKHYDVTQEGVSEMIRTVREWLSKQPHLPGDKLHDKQIIGHLMLRGFSVEKFKTTLDDYFIAPHRMADIVCNRDPLEPQLAETLKEGYWVVMPNKTPDDYRISIYRSKPCENFTLSLLAKVPFIIMEYRIWNDASLGDCWIFDLEHINIQDILQMTPNMISNIIFYVMACFGAKLKSIHITNMPPFAAALINIFKKVIKSKLGDRIFVVEKEELLNVFPKECLPDEYGGVAGAFEDFADKFCKTIQSDAWRQYLIDQDNVVSDEAKRMAPNPNTVVFDNDIFGTDGSFRKICLD